MGVWDTTYVSLYVLGLLMYRLYVLRLLMLFRSWAPHISLRKWVTHWEIRHPDVRRKELPRSHQCSPERDVHQLIWGNWKESSYKGSSTRKHFQHCQPLFQATCPTSAISSGLRLDKGPEWLHWHRCWVWEPGYAAGNRCEDYSGGCIIVVD